MNILVLRDGAGPTPEDAQLTSWALKAWPEEVAAGELVIRLVAEAESRRLNHEYRGKDKPTNVLSFPAALDWPADYLEALGEERPLGDLVICAEVVRREASEQGKDEHAHWAHMVIHGCLHLQGWDHIEDEQAEQMEAQERRLLAELNFPDPYE